MRNGRRLKHAWPRVERAIAALRQTARDLTVGDCESDAVLFGDIATALRQAASLLELRFGYLNVAPWCFANADSKEGATRFLASATSRPFAQQDPLTQYLYHTYCEDLKELAASGTCSRRLLEEVDVYCQTPLDESAGEGYHRSTHLTRIRARSSSIAYVKMSVRLNQNIDQLKVLIRMGEAGKRVLRYEWSKWSRVLQTRRRQLWKKKHWSTTKVLERIYRMDQLAEEDWSSIATPIAAPGQGPDPNCDKCRETDREMHGLRIEYLLDVLDTKQWYTVSVPVTRMGEDGVEERSTEPRYFQLLHMTHTKSRPKLMPTIESWDNPVLHKQLALNLQETAVRPIEGEEGDGSILVYPDAEPRWVGYEDIGPWNKVLTTLQRFGDVRGTPDHPGCFRLSAPEFARPAHPLTDLKCPTLCIVTELYRRGWRPVRRRVTHASLDCGPIDGREAVAMKAYYIVVLEIHRCLPLCAGIPSDQPIPFYKCLLDGKAVEPGLGVAAYRRVLTGDPDPPAAIEDPGEVLC